MNLVEKEIRDYLQANLGTVNTAASGTTTTNITIVAHGLNVGDNIINTTRTSGNVAVSAIVDADNFTVPTIASQTSGDSITFVPFKRHFVGKIKDDIVQTNNLPFITVHGTQSSLFAPRANIADRFEFNIEIAAYTNAFDFVANADLTNDILAAQQNLRQIMESRDPTTNKLLTSSILGLMTHNVAPSPYSPGWKTFLYHDSYKIQYDQGIIKNKIFYKAVLNLRCVTSSTLRP